MSGRYETPSWDDGLEKLERDKDVPETGEPDLDASSENVLEGWPAAEIEVESEAGEAEPEPEVEAGEPEP